MSGTPGPDDGSDATDATAPQARDLVDVRLLEAMRLGGCPICAVRARSERATLDAIINERVLDIGFRAELERSQGFCRRHVAELLPTDRRETGGMLGSSMLLSAVIARRTADLDAAIGSRGRGLRARLKRARERPPCIACSQGATAVETALVRLSERAGDAAWGAALTAAPLCLDDFLALWATAGSDPGFEPVARAQLARFDRPAPAARRVRPALEPRPVSPADRGGADRRRRGDARPSAATVGRAPDRNPGPVPA